MSTPSWEIGEEVQMIVVVPGGIGAGNGTISRIEGKRIYVHDPLNKCEQGPFDLATGQGSGSFNEDECIRKIVENHTL